MIRSSMVFALLFFVVPVVVPIAGADEAPPAPEWTDAAFEPDAEIPFDPGVRTGMLDNGLRWYVRENDEPRERAALRLVVNAGSILEDDDQRGLAHFLEHMAFNGTENFEKQELVDYLESIGMKFGPEINAYTSFDETVYMLQVPTDDAETLDRAFTVLADWSRRQLLDDEEVVKERGVVLEEWRLGRGAQQRVRDAQLPELYFGSRYAERLPIGQPEIIETADRARLERFYRDWYRPDLMAVVAVGDFDADTVVAAIEANFGESWGPDDPEERTVFDVPAHDETRFAIVTDPELSNTSIGVTVKQPRRDRTTVADHRRGLVESLFTGMLNQRLRELLQESDPPFVFGGVGAGRFSRTTDSVRLYAVAEDGGVERALEAVLIEARRVAQHGFTASELERRKTDLLRSMRRQFEQRGSRENPSYAGAYVGHFLADRNVPGVTWRYEAAQRLVPTIELEEVNAVDLAGRLLEPENRVITVDMPEKDDLTVPTEDQLLAVFERVQSMDTEVYVDDVGDDPLLATTPPSGRIVDEERVEELDLTIWTLDNGHRVLVKPTDFEEDSFSFTAFSPGGRTVGTLGLDRSLDFATQIVGTGGLGDFDAVELQKKLSGKRARVNPWIGTFEEGLRGGGSPEDLQTVFELAWKTLRDPGRDDEAIAALRQRYTAVLRNRAADPNSVYGDTLQAVLTKHHPWSTPLSAETMESIDVDRSYEFYRERFADVGDMTWIFVGALDVEALRPMIETYVGGLPADDDPDTWRDPGVTRPEGPLHRVVRVGVDEKARTTLFMHGDLEWTRANRTLTNWLEEALSIRLREVIREEMSGTYGVSVSMSTNRRPEPGWQITISFGADPERLDELVDEVLAVLRTVRDEGIDPQIVEKVREQTVRSYEEGVRENGYWLGTLATRERHEIDHREQLETLEFLEGLRKSDLDAVAAWALPVESIVRVDMMPETPAGKR